MNQDVECPYCEKWNEICHDDGFGYEEGVRHEIECAHCDKNFVFETSISFSYEGYVADCLNGDPHNFKPQKTFPREFTKMVCTDCELSRKPTDNEWTLILNSPPNP